MPHRVAHTRPRARYTVGGCVCFLVDAHAGGGVVDEFFYGGDWFSPHRRVRDDFERFRARYGCLHRVDEFD